MSSPSPERIARLSQALDDEVQRQALPSDDMIEQEIAGMRAESPELGEEPDDTEHELRQMSAAFWHDWFAVDALRGPLGMTDEEVWGLCLAREAARRPRMGPQA